MYTVQMDNTLTRNETRRKTNLAKHYRARVFEKKGGRPYARLREAVRFTIDTSKSIIIITTFPPNFRHGASRTIPPLV